MIAPRPPTSEPSNAEPRRRFWQYGLRSLLILVTLAAVLLAVWRAYLAPYHRQRETMALVADLGGTYKTEAAEKWLRRLYGDDFQSVILVDLAEGNNPSTYLEQVASLPQLRTLVVGGREFTDKQLARLGRMESLRGLVLDSTAVTDGGVSALKRMSPNLVMYKSQRRAIAALRRLVRDLDGHVGTRQCRECPQLRQIVGDEYFEDAIDAGVEDCQTANFSVHLEGLHRLEELCLGFSRISDADLRNLKGLTQLQLLDLRYTKVTDAGLVHLKGLTSLRLLDLQGTQVTGAGLVHLQRLPYLKNLYLLDTKIDDRTLDTHGVFKPGKRKWPSLSLLNLRQTQVTQSGISRLRRALPNCAILPESDQ